MNTITVNNLKSFDVCWFLFCFVLLKDNCLPSFRDETNTLKIGKKVKFSKTANVLLENSSTIYCYYYHCIKFVPSNVLFYCVPFTIVRFHCCYCIDSLTVNANQERKNKRKKTTTYAFVIHWADVIHGIERKISNFDSL